MRNISEQSNAVFFFLFNLSLFMMLAGFPVGYAAAAPAYTPNVYAGANPAFPNGKSRTV